MSSSNAFSLWSLRNVKYYLVDKAVAVLESQTTCLFRTWLKDQITTLVS